MQKKIWLLALVVAAALLSGSAAWAQGDFYVVAGGGQPVGTKITSVPYTINSPGFYFLTGNLTYSPTSGNAITIGADDATLDLMGFSLIGPGGSTGAIGVYMNGHSNAEVRNGSVRGFGTGVYEESVSGSKDRVINVRAYHNSYGIILFGNNHLIKDCSASNNNTQGLFASSGLIVDSEANNNGSAGIVLDGPGSVLGNTACNNGIYNFLFGSGSATSILVDRNSAFGKSPNYDIVSGTGIVVFGTNSGTP
jgi:hypothetical protein